MEPIGVPGSEDHVIRDELTEDGWARRLPFSHTLEYRSPAVSDVLSLGRPNGETPGPANYAYGRLGGLG
jgi:hypothetical protein